jgi:hypothetical protein
MDIDALTIQFLIASCATGLTNHCPLLIMHAFESKEDWKWVSEWKAETESGAVRVVLQALIYEQHRTSKHPQNR